MQRTERQLTDVEMIDAFLEILSIIIKGYKDPIRPEFYKESRAGQVGYDIVEHLVREDILRPGKLDQQEKLKL